MDFRLQEVLDEIEVALNKREPFSITRAGDNELSQYFSLVRKKDKGIDYSPRQKRRFRAMGYDENTVEEVLARLIKAQNESDFTSGFGTVVNSKVFWRDLSYATGTSEDTSDMMKHYQEIYQRVGMENTNFVCPDINFKLFLRGWRNLKILLNETGVRCMVINPYAKEMVKQFDDNGVKVTVPIVIPNRGGQLYSEFEQLKEGIVKMKDQFDVMLVGAGVLGSVFVAEGKRLGKIAIDCGKVFEAWAPKHVIPPGYTYWLSHKYSRWVFPRADFCDFQLTREGRDVYARYL